MALTSSGLLKSSKFLCKYMRISQPSTVVCYVHSQLAVQPYNCNVQGPFIFMFNNSPKTEQGGVQGYEAQHVQGFVFSVNGKGIVSHQKGISQPVKPWGCIKETHKNSKDLSPLMARWNHDLLMDHKQMVSIISKDAFTGRTSLDNRENLFNSSSLQEVKKPFRTPAEEQKSRQTCSISVHRSSKDQNPSMQQPKEQVSQIFYSNQSIDKSTSKAALLFTDFCSAGKDVRKTDMKKDFRSGPDPTQLSSILLVLREEIPEFFLKKPNYDIYHKKIKFVNNITGITTHGIYPYRSQISGLRLLMLSCMSKLSVEVLKITKHPNEAAIKVRWRIKGIPLIRKAVPYIGRRIKVDADGYRYLDGFSVFEVGSDGLIHCHRLHKVMPSSSKEKESPLWMVVFLPLINILNPRHCESFGAYFECRSTDNEIQPAATDSDALAC